MSKALMFGYLESWGDITFTQAAEQGFDAIVMAFGVIDGLEVGIYDGEFHPAPTPEKLQEDIENAKDLGAQQILFSVGGANNTYKPDISIPADNLASKLVSFLLGNGFTGVDFDIEIDGTQADFDYLDELCDFIQQESNELIITGAPQFNQAQHDSDLLLVSTGNTPFYQKAMDNGRFDYLLIQAYNNDWPQLDGKSEMDVEFIEKSFNNLRQTIPASTLIVIGEPADKEAAGSASVYYGPSAGPNIYQLMADQYAAIKSDLQFGGAMEWSVNADASNHYQFIKAIKPVI